MSRYTLEWEHLCPHTCIYLWQVPRCPLHKVWPFQLPGQCWSIISVAARFQVFVFIFHLSYSVMFYVVLIFSRLLCGGMAAGQHAGQCVLYNYFSKIHMQNNGPHQKSHLQCWHRFTSQEQAGGDRRGTVYVYGPVLSLILWEKPHSFHSKNRTAFPVK